MITSCIIFISCSVHILILYLSILVRCMLICPMRTNSHTGLLGGVASSVLCSEATKRSTRDFIVSENVCVHVVVIFLEWVEGAYTKLFLVKKDKSV